MNKTGVLILAFVSLINSFQILAQSNFQPGSVVTVHGDELKGLIDNRDWDISPKEIIFKTFDEGEQIVYKPETIQSFKVGNYHYISHRVNVDVSLQALASLPNDPMPEMKEMPLFLEVILDAEKSLLYHKNNEGREYFFVRQGNDVEWLYYRKFVLKVTSGKFAGNQIQTVDRYKGQLKVYLADCPNVAGDIMRTSYAKTSMVKLFQKYYSRCFGVNYKQIEKPKAEFHPGIVVGATFTSLSFTGTVKKWLVESDFQPSINFTGGLAMEIIFPANNKRFSVYTELLRTQMKFESSVLYYQVTDFSTYKDNHLEMKYLKFIVMPQYNYHFDHFTLHGHIGISYASLRWLNDYTVTRQVKFGEESSTTSCALSFVRGYDIGTYAGIGVKFLDRINLRITYERNMGPSTSIGLKSHLSSVYTTVSYLF